MILEIGLLSFRSFTAISSAFSHKITPRNRMPVSIRIFSTSLYLPTQQTTCPRTDTQLRGGRDRPPDTRQPAHQQGCPQSSPAQPSPANGPSLGSPSFSVSAAILRSHARGLVGTPVLLATKSPGKSMTPDAQNNGPCKTTVRGNAPGAGVESRAAWGA